MAAVTAAPLAMPASATQTNVSEADASENWPVTAAATAKRKQTRPVASLSSDSPSRMCIRRRGIGTRLVIDDSATGSVGATIAASANETDSGSIGSSQWIRKPAPTTVNSTRPNASSRITALSRNRPSLGMRQPSRNSSGGRNSRKNISGSSETPCWNTPAMTAPSAICASGSGSAKGRMRTRYPLATTASNMASTNSSDAMRVSRLNGHDKRSRLQPAVALTVASTSDNCVVLTGLTR